MCLVPIILQASLIINISGRKQLDFLHGVTYQGKIAFKIVTIGRSDTHTHTHTHTHTPFIFKKNLIPI